MVTMTTAINSKGQLVIPAHLRKQMKLSPGTKISIRRQGQSLVLLPITGEFIDGLIGCTQGAGMERDRMHRNSY
jgi:AbrB family looped-hinge helix DNA binding protein